MTSLETNNATFHDTQLDYYGKRLAAACGAPVVPVDGQPLPEGDYTVMIWDVTDGQQKPVGQLKGHEGPVWKVAWAHPKFGSLIATCGYDMKVIIWKEVNSQWQKAYVDTSHAASVNDIEFCPWEHGLRLACASSDGTVSVLTYVATEARWARAVFPAHAAGAQTVSWAPLAQQRDGQLAQMRMATGGADNAVCLWKCDGENWAQEMPLLLPAHSDWVRKVAWRPDGSNTVASGSWDKTVSIWKQEMEGQPWRQVSSITCGDRVESVGWSVTGSILGVAFGDGESALYKETYDGRYEGVGRCNEQGYVDLEPKPAPPAAVAAAGFEAPPPAQTQAQQDQAQAQAQEQAAAASLSNELAAQQAAQAAEQAAAQASVMESFGM